MLEFYYKTKYNMGILWRRKQLALAENSLYQATEILIIHYMWSGSWKDHFS